MFCSEKILWDYLDSGFFYCFALQRFHFWLSVQKCDSAKKQRDSSKKTARLPTSAVLQSTPTCCCFCQTSGDEEAAGSLHFCTHNFANTVNQPKFAQKKARKQNGTEIAVKTIPKKLRKVCTSVVDPDFFDRIRIRLLKAYWSESDF